MIVSEEALKHHQSSIIFDIVKCIQSLPQKSLLYADLVGLIGTTHSDLATEIVRNAMQTLQESLVISMNAIQAKSLVSK
jgi:hypothetical protein